MKIKLPLSLSLVFLLLMACETKEPPRITTDPVMLSMDSIAEDTTKVLIAELPVWFDSTQVLIHAIGFKSITDRNLKNQIISKSGEYNDYGDSYGLSFSKSSNTITGRIANLYFDNTETDTQRLLTDKVMNIVRITYLRGLAKKIKRDYLIYEVYDKDYNGDGKLNGSDMLALYISSLDGDSFTKITEDYHAYVEGYPVVMNSRFYFRTYEDINKNYRFDRKIDKYHYLYIDFSGDTYTVKKYNPFVEEPE